MSWAGIESKQGETIQHYVHSFGSADATTKLKPASYASPVDITAVVRSQPTSVAIIPGGVMEVEVVLILTDTSIAIRDRFKWNSKYWEAVSLDEVWFKGSKQYYRASCVEVLHFDPPT